MADSFVLIRRSFHQTSITGYASIGYKAKGESFETESIDIIFDKCSFLPVYTNDIVNSAREILIVSPFVTKKRTLQMMQYLEIALENKVRIIVVTRPVEDFKDKNRSTLQSVMDLINDAGISIAFKPNIHQKFAIMGQRMAWYGSINLLSFGSAEESVMRLESPNIANELMKSIENH